MMDRPIIFSAPTMQALIAGRKIALIADRHHSEQALVALAASAIAAEGERE